MRKLFFVILAMFVLSSCAITAHKMNSLSLGMTKQDVITIMGAPISIAAQGKIEYLRYGLTESENDSREYPYYVKIIDGKVESYGKVGDFDSTKDPVLHLKTEDLNSQH